jgi:type II secretory pathway component PulJ
MAPGRFDGTVRPRAGVSLAELLVAMTAGAVVVAAAAGLLQVQARGAMLVREALLGADAERVAAAVLAAELRHATAADIADVQPSVLRLRAFRGYGVPCARADSVLHVRYRGARDPDPRKDSLLIVSSAGESVAALASSGASPGLCAPLPGERVLRLGAALPPDTAIVVLLFELGEYHLSGNALRYRTGDANRQPVTAELFRTPGSGFTPVEQDRTVIGIRLLLARRAVAGRLPRPPAARFLPLGPTVHGERAVP